jgi:hypothetical protein
LEVPDLRGMVVNVQEQVWPKKIGEGEEMEGVETAGESEDMAKADDADGAKSSKPASPKTSPKTKDTEAKFPIPIEAKEPADVDRKYGSISRVE